MFVIELATGFVLKTAKEAFEGWAKKEGVTLIDNFVKNGLYTEGAFLGLGKHHAVENHLWKETSLQIDQPTLRLAIEAEAAAYTALAGALCSNSDNLPRVSLSYPLKAVQAVPRRAINEASFRALRTKIGNADLVRGSQADSGILVNRFLRDLVAEFDKQYSEAYRKHSPEEIRKPRQSGDDWTVVSMDDRFAWEDTNYSGHYLLYNDKIKNLEGLSKDDKKTVQKGMAELEAKLGRLSTAEKTVLMKSLMFRTQSKYSTGTEQWGLI